MWRCGVAGTYQQPWEVDRKDKWKAASLGDIVYRALCNSSTLVSEGSQMRISAALSRALVAERYLMGVKPLAGT